MSSTPQLSLVVGTADDRPGATPVPSVGQGNQTLHIHLHLANATAPHPAEPAPRNAPAGVAGRRRVGWPMLTGGAGALVVAAYLAGGWTSGSPRAPSIEPPQGLPFLPAAGNAAASQTDEVAHLRQQLAQRPTVTIPGHPDLPPEGPKPSSKPEAPAPFGLEN